MGGSVQTTRYCSLADQLRSEFGIHERQGLESRILLLDTHSERPAFHARVPSDAHRTLLSRYGYL